MQEHMLLHTRQLCSVCNLKQMDSMHILILHSYENPYSSNNYIFICLLLAQQRPVDQGLLIHEVSRSHTTQHSRYNSSGRVISSSQRPLPVNTHHSKQTDIHAAGGIRTHNLSRQAAADLRLRPRGHRYRL